MKPYVQFAFLCLLSFPVFWVAAVLHGAGKDVPTKMAVPVVKVYLLCGRECRQADHEKRLTRLFFDLRAKQCLEYVPLIAQETARIGMNPELAGSLIFHESSCSHYVVSHAGAIGLTQVHADTWAREMGFEANNPFDPATNLRMGLGLLQGWVMKYGERRALQLYYGISEGSDRSHQYAQKVGDF